MGKIKGWKKQKTKKGLEYWINNYSYVLLEKTFSDGTLVARVWVRKEDNINRTLIEVPHIVNARADKDFVRNARKYAVSYMRSHPNG